MSHLLPVNCRYCAANCIKKGWYKAVQKYYCKTCGKFQRQQYSYKPTSAKDDNNIALLNNEGMGISSIGRYLHIAKTTVRRRILIISKRLTAPHLLETNQVYEVDEMQAFIFSRPYSPFWISCPCLPASFVCRPGDLSADRQALGHVQRTLLYNNFIAKTGVVLKRRTVVLRSCPESLPNTWL